MEVKNNYARVTTQQILNKFIELNFSVWNHSKNIDEIYFLFLFSGTPE